MIKAVIPTLGVSFVCLATALAQPVVPAPTQPVEDAITESVRRETFKIDLHRKLADAQATLKRGELHPAARLYDECLDLVKKIGTGVEADTKQVINGMVAVRMRLAEEAQRHGDFAEANTQVGRILKELPKHDKALAFKRDNDKLRLENEGRTPSKETIDKLPEVMNERVKTAILVQDGKLLYEAGKYAEAEAKLVAAIKLDSSNKAAFYYLDKVMDIQYAQQNRIRESWSKERMLEVSRAWNTPGSSSNT